MLSSYSTAVDRAENISLAVFDVDGVLTGGELIYSELSGEIRKFHVHDGLGLKLLKSSGCEVAFISSRSSEIVARRLEELGISEVYHSQKNKADTLTALMEKFKLERTSVAFTGDDLVDIPAMKLAGLSIAVANAHPLVKQQADWVTSKQGGDGAVREICDLILTAQGKLETVIKQITG